MLLERAIEAADIGHLPVELPVSLQAKPPEEEARETAGQQVVSPAIRHPIEGVAIQEWSQSPVLQTKVEDGAAVDRVPAIRPLRPCREPFAEQGQPPRVPPLAVERWVISCFNGS